MGKYASGTETSPEKTMQEIRQTIVRFGATIDQGREEYFKAKIRRGALDRAMGLPQDFIR